MRNYQLRRNLCLLFANKQQRKKIVDFYVQFLQRARSPNRPPLDSYQLPTDYEIRTLTNLQPATDRQLLVEEDMLMKSLYGFFRGMDNIVHHRPALHLLNVKQIQATMRYVVTTYLYAA